MKKIILGIFTIILSMNTYSWNSPDLNINYIDVKSGGGVSVYFTVPSNTPNPAGCSQVGTVSWEGSNPSGSNFLSTMLAAQASGKQVQILVDTGACLWGGWPSLWTVRIKST